MSGHCTILCILRRCTARLVMQRGAPRRSLQLAPRRLAPGSVTAALKAAKENAGHMVTVEIEIDTLEQLDEALQEGTDVVLLDNMSPDMLREAVTMVNGKATTEASGRVSLETVADIARTGVDYISVGKITHSSPTMDFGLDMEIFS